MDAFLQRIERDTKSLSRNGKILFAVLTAEKMLPYYSAFQNSCKWGDEEILRESIDTVYLYLVDKATLTDDGVGDLLDRMESITPDTEDFSHDLTSFALDACASVAATLDFILDNDDQHIVTVASIAMDTVDRFIQMKKCPDLLITMSEKEIDQDPFMMKEKVRQTELIIGLREVTDRPVTDALIQKFRNQKAIIDLSLMKLENR